MAKQKLRIRAVRLEPELNKRVERATREGGFSNPSAFIRGAIERELAGRESGVDAAEDRLAASLDRFSREIRGVKLGQQALFAFVDSLVKTFLTCIRPAGCSRFRQGALLASLPPIPPVLSRWQIPRRHPLSGRPWPRRRP
jgi:Arc/MetJ-type ribon-helix-helix transcriptional regulator